MLGEQKKFKPMKFIRDIYAAKKATGQPVISLEFFPPKTAEGDRALFEKHLPALLAARPDFYRAS